jgi:hypothetical protein
VTRRLWPALLLLLTIRAKAFGSPKFEIVEAECSHDGTIVGVASDLRLLVLRNEHWQPMPVAPWVLRLWRSPDDRIFALGGDPWSVVEVPAGAGPATRWTIPTDFGTMRFASVNGIDVVTHDRVFRLDPGGTLTSLGETPIGGSRQPLHARAPEILAAAGTTVVCTGTSQRLDDYVGGSCLEGRGAYVYDVDFGEPLCCVTDVQSFTAPFICGNAVVSAIRRGTRSQPRDATQARTLATGALVGRRQAAARRGSACLDGKRALLVGKKDVRVVSVPDLRVLWRQTIARGIGAVAVCRDANKATVIPRMDPDSVQVFDLANPSTEHKGR